MNGDQNLVPGAARVAWHSQPAADQEAVRLREGVGMGQLVQGRVDEDAANDQPAEQPQEAEVEELFGIPVEALLTMEIGEAKIVEEYSLSEEFPREYLPAGRWRGRQERPVYFFRYERFFVWGLTASILMDLLPLLASAFASGGQSGSAG